MLKFFRLPFATTGDKTAVPDAVDSNGNVSYSQGYGFDYQRQKTDPAAKNIERDKMNQIFFDVTTAVAELQANGIPDFITTALNGGTAYSYAQYAVVKYSGDLYISLVAANTALPSDATKWALLPTPARIQAAFNSSAIAAGTADALTGAFSPAIAALPAAPGTLSVLVRAGSANATATPTFKADGTVAKTIVKGNNLPLVAGDIAGAGHWLDLQYDATLDKWVLQNPAYGVAIPPAPTAFKNLVYNPRAAVYQRTVTATADDAYFADRWYALTQTGTVLPSVLTDPENGYPFGVQLTQSQVAAQRFGFAQILEGKNCKQLRGGSGTLVPRIRASTSQAVRYAILGWTGSEDAVISDVVNDWTSASYTAGGFFIGANLSVLAVGAATPGANAWTSLPALTAAMGSAFNNIVVMVWTENTAAQNFTLDFDYVQFEAGAASTEFETRPFGVELDLCMRYYERNRPSAGAQAVFGTGQAFSGIAWSATVPFAIKKRSIPSSVLFTVGTGQVLLAGGGIQAIASVSTYYPGLSTVRIDGTVASGLVAGNASLLLAQDASTFLDINSEL